MVQTALRTLARSARRIVLLVLLCGLFAGTLAGPAAAYHGHHHGHHHGGFGGWGHGFGGWHHGFGGWGGPGFGFGGPRFGFGGFGGVSRVAWGNSFVGGGGQFFSGSMLVGGPWLGPCGASGGWYGGPSFWYGRPPYWAGNGWGSPWWGPPVFACPPLMAIGFAPAFAGTRAAIYPQFVSQGSPAPRLIASAPLRSPAGGLRQGPAFPEPAFGRGQLGASPIDASVQLAIRTSNSKVRSRAERLVTIGDRHLRAAIADPKKLPAAIDAYRRAALIATDLPEIFIRQAIALSAAGKPDAASKALDRAVAIDRRLADESASDRAPGRDPVFVGTAVPGGRQERSQLALRSEKILGRIFAAVPGEIAAGDGQADNWIAQRFRDRGGIPLLAAVRR